MQQPLPFSLEGMEERRGAGFQSDELDGGTIMDSSDEASPNAMCAPNDPGVGKAICRSLNASGGIQPYAKAGGWLMMCTGEWGGG